MPLRGEDPRGTVEGNCKKREIQKGDGFTSVKVSKTRTVEQKKEKFLENKNVSNILQLRF